MILTAARRARPGFTLVELLVAAAVCVLIMAVLSTAFSISIDTVRHMKSAGDLMDQLRGAGTAMKADLAAPHLMDRDGNRVKLSSIRADKTKIKDNGKGNTPRYTIETPCEYPTNGFVRICAPPINYPAGSPTDADGLNAGTGIATTHYLHFTSILTGNADDEYFRTSVPSGGSPYHSTAAEVAWFLEPMGTTAGGNGLHRLIRRQRLVALNDTDRRDRPWPATVDEAVISHSKPTATTVNPYPSTLAELTNPFNRHGGTRWVGAKQVGPGYAFQGTPAQDDALAPMLSRTGEDTVVSNVISFEVQVAWIPSSHDAAYDAALPYGPVTGPPSREPDAFDTAKNKTDNPFDTLPKVQSTWTNSGLANTHTYDSWSSDFDWTSSYDHTLPDANRPPLVINVRAVQVRIRIWDPKMQTARQVSFVQDL